MKTILLVILSLLVTLVILGCNSTPEVTVIKVGCNLPERPNLPKVDAADLWDKLGSNIYSNLQLREKLIVDWALELEVIAKGVCNE